MFTVEEADRRRVHRVRIEGESKAPEGTSAVEAPAVEAVVPPAPASETPAAAAPAADAAPAGDTTPAAWMPGLAAVHEKYHGPLACQQGRCL